MRDILITTVEETVQVQAGSTIQPVLLDYRTSGCEREELKEPRKN